MADTGDLADAVAQLDPQPRSRRWTSLTYCLVDAVWSIGSAYDSVVVPIVRKVASDLGDDAPSQPATDPLGPDPAPLAQFLERYPTVDSLVVRTNRQLTSTRNGTLKAEAARRHAAIFASHGAITIGHAQAGMLDAAWLDRIDLRLRNVPGEGGYGIRRGYLWMLLGDDDHVKPDRMVLRWLDRHGVRATPAEAVELLRDIAKTLTSRGRPTTPWEVDHAIWLAARSS